MRPASMFEEALAASRLSPLALFEKRCRLQPDAPAVSCPSGEHWSYADLDRLAAALDAQLAASGVRRGDRIAILSENHPFFLLLSVAAMRAGLVVATLNWRMSTHELAYCIGLVEPTVIFASSRMRHLLEGIGSAGVVRDIEATLRELETLAPDVRPAQPQDSEDGLFIIYTSGTTGLPKGALISQRAMLARLLVYVTDYGVDSGDTFLAWSPLFHMASVELSLGTLLLGGKVVVLDGPDLPLICDYLERESLSNLIVFPGMVQRTLEYLRERRPVVRRLKKFGALADLFAPNEIAELTAILGVPFTNTFGSTETGMPPASAGLLECGKEPVELAKTESLLCEVALVDEAGQPVAIGEAGELVMRGPTLFSGYWNAPDATREAFAGGWYHSGDVFVRLADGRLRYVDRKKYLIKSGGENIYPAEIERVILRHPKVVEAVVVRQPDPKWGETPVLVVAADEPAPTADDLIGMCRAELAAYKRPSRVVFVPKGTLPRNNTGKILHREVEQWLRSASVEPDAESKSS